MKKWINWLLALSLCGNVILGAVLAGRSHEAVRSSAPVSAAEDAGGIDNGEEPDGAKAAEQGLAEAVDHTWVLQWPERWQGDLLEPAVIEVPANKTELEAVVSYFLETYDIGYELKQMEFVEAIGANTCRLVFGEQTDRWEQVRPFAVYAAFDGIWQTLSKRTRLEYGYQEMQLLLCREDGSPLTFPIDSAERALFANAPATWLIPVDRPFTGSGADCLWRQEQVQPRWSWSANESPLFSLVSPLRGDSTAEEINNFIATISSYTRGPWQELSPFNNPAQANPAFIRTAALRSAAQSSVFNWNMEQCYATPEELEYLYPVYHALSGEALIPRFYVEYAARQLFGDDLEIEHDDAWFMWRYSELSAAYAVFQGGGAAGGGEPVLLEYRYNGNTIVAVVASGLIYEMGTPGFFIVLHDGSEKHFLVDESGSPLDPAALQDCLVNEAVRSQITLTSRPEGRFYLMGYKPLG